jgi:pyruvate carboxylase
MLLRAGAVRHLALAPRRPIKKLMAANRGEIAICIFRAATELDIRTVAIYSKEDMKSMHRYKADEAYMVGANASPVGAYLGYEEIVETALAHDVDAIHPGYGFLSENVHFARLCEANGIAFIGPESSVLNKFGDKTLARALAIAHDVPVVPGTEGECNTLDEVRAFVEGGADPCGYPVIVKAAHGGGGRGMRVVRAPEELAENLARAQSEALSAFGNAAVFVERYVDDPRHVEVQILSDGESTVHLYERDCSVQRRFQKVVEIAPAFGLPAETRAKLLDDAVRLTSAAGYRCAGTVEFLVDPTDWSHYFIEVNPRIQVEHTVTEVVTGIDLVQSQIEVTAGKTLAEIGIPDQAAVAVRGYAIQSRVTTEDPEADFRPDVGRLQVWRPAEGFGIRLDGGNSFTGAVISPHYDSMLMKVTGSALTYQGAIDKVSRALRETRIRGVKTNINFTLNVLKHPEFRSGAATTSFIGDHPELFDFKKGGDRASKLLEYLADLAVNGRRAVGAAGPTTPRYDAVLPPSTAGTDPPAGLKQVLDAEGPEGFAKAVRNTEGLLLTDTTMRDAHQSLLATRVRTKDLLTAAPYAAHALHNCYSLENWGGATFDVALRFLHECPWERLAELREKVPNVPFQMLLRGANGVGYTSYPDNAVFKFCDVAKQAGMDVFRVFDSLNYADNLYLGIDAVGEAGGVVECAISYSGDCTDPDSKYNLDYYLTLAGRLHKKGIHVLAIKDMAGLLKPAAATALVRALRLEYPDLPIHVHTHDTAGTGVASMLAAAHAGADAVDVAIDSMSGTTSQPSMGAVVASLAGTHLDTGVDLAKIAPLIDYWESVRVSYAAFESGQKSGSAEVYDHEIPGGQYTNMLFQATQMGLSEKWPAVKRAYRDANDLLGDIVKVTPSSKTCGDLAQFMVTNNLSAADVERDAAQLNFPQSVVEFFQGALGVPVGGFPEPLRSRVLESAGSPETFSGRPGAELEPIDLEATRAALEAAHGVDVDDRQLMSAVMYPAVFDDFMATTKEFGELGRLPTRSFVEPMEVGEELELSFGKGVTVTVKLLGMGDLDPKTGSRECFFELNGRPRSVVRVDRSSASASAARPKAVPSEIGSIGAPMPGVVVDVKAAVGDWVDAGQPLVVLSAMKMETVVSAACAGTLANVAVDVNDDVQPGDLICIIDEKSTDDKE